VNEGETFGLLGANEAGKTPTASMSLATPGSEPESRCS
jgi:ABC-type multidrug transport system ATPase subunit